MYEENEEFEREMNYKSPSQVMGDAVAREFADGQEEEEDGWVIETARYITVLDFEIGRVFQYKIGVKEVKGEYHSNKWYPDGESCEEFLTKNHNLSNCEWMVHENPQIITN